MILCRKERFPVRRPAAERFAPKVRARSVLRCFLLALVLACASSPAALVINEVCYDNEFLADETGTHYSDWIELYNTGPDGINVLNYALGDSNPFEVGKGVLLPNYTIPSGGFLVVFASTDLPQYTIWTNPPNVNLIPANATWKYYSAASAPPATWKTNDFNDANWAIRHGTPGIQRRHAQHGHCDRAGLRR